jgi:hypothetical protein
MLIILAVIRIMTNICNKGREPLISSILQITQKEHISLWMDVSEHDSVQPLKGNPSTTEQLSGRLHCG